MASRQFRSDDTSTWSDRYGSGADGAKTVSGAETYDGARASCSGSSGGTSLTLGAASTFADGDLVVIHQTRGTGAGNWELNKISSGGGTTSLTLAYSLINTYTDSGDSQAQIIEMKQYSSVAINSTLSAPEWDGDTGGGVAFFCTGTVNGSGTIDISGKGFRGGAADRHGESHNLQPTTTSEGGGGVANEGGGGGCPTGNNENGGGGGGYGTAGGAASGGISNPAGGGTYGVAALTSLHLGSGGGGSHASAGADGAGFLLIIAKTIDFSSMTTVNCNGLNTSDQNSGVGIAGAGSGGSILLKGQTLNLGTGKVTASGGTAGNNPGAGADGGDGGVGRIHADYSTSISGTTTPTIDSTLDATLADSSGVRFINFI